MSQKTRKFGTVIIKKDMSKIYEFNPVIYPFRLYVAVDMTNKDTLDGFNYENSE